MSRYGPGVTPLDDRRHRALETYYNTCADGRGRTEGSAIALEAAIETATRVRLDETTLSAARAESPDGFVAVRAIKAAFEAAGFEVEE